MPNRNSLQNFVSANPLTRPQDCRRRWVKGSVSLRGTLAALALLVVGSLQQALAATTTHTCKSVDVSAYAERIHVRCDVAAPGGFVYFSLATANSAHAARMLSLLTAAHVVQKAIRVEFDPNDTSGTAFGCLASDCRRLLSVGVL